MKLKKQMTLENVTFVGKDKTWFESLSYSDLLAERKFLRAEVRRIKTAIRFTQRIDIRGMFSETHDVIHKLNGMVEACEWAINGCQEQMLRKMEAGE